MTVFLNPIAELDAPDSGKIILPNPAYNIKDKHKFFCPDYDCKDEKRILTVKKSSKDNYFFSHRRGSGHDIQPETLLHKLAIKWFLIQDEYEIPSLSLTGKKLVNQIVQLDKSKTECEFRKLKRIIPDVKLITENGFIFAIEIVVTSDINDSKSKLIEEFNLPTIRVDLSTFYNANKKSCQVDYEFIQNNLPTLLTDINLKSWVIPPKYESINDKFEFIQTNTNNGCLPILAGLGFFLLIRALCKFA